MSQKLKQKATNYLEHLCNTITDRSVGSYGNRKASNFVVNTFKSLGWNTEMPGFEVMDWQSNGARLTCKGQSFIVHPGPYSRGCDLKGKLMSAKTLQELEAINAKDSVLLIHGEIAKEQLMPKNFVFYNPEEHRHLVYLLENSRAAAIISATGRNAALAGGVYPFPLIEDGDFDIPNLYMTEEEGKALLNHIGETIALKSDCERTPAKAYNPIGRIGNNSAQKIVITAHIDAKKGSPGAIDNATGVTVLLLLAELLKNYNGPYQIELVPFNGEDYYAVPGQMNYINSKQGDFSDIALNINIDGAAYLKGPSAFSFYQLPKAIKTKMQGIIRNRPDIVEGTPWVQGDHSIFVQFGCPAIAVSSQWFIDNIETQTITHTEKDNLSIVNAEKVVQIAGTIADLINQL
ncbi:MAG: M28 family peptidase [Fidelibacterota bacterium]